MKVVYVLPHATRGGAELVTMDLIALHDRAAVQPSVIFLSDGPLVQEARSAGVGAEVVPAPRMRQTFAARRVRRLLASRFRALGAQLVHSVMSWGHLYAGRAARRAGIPAVWFQHNLPRWRGGHDVLAALVPSRRIFANSALTAARQRRFNPLRAPVEVVYPGARILDEPRAARRSRGRAAIGVDDDAFLVGMVARIARGKGHGTLLRAAASLCNARGDSSVVIAGAALFGIDTDYPDDLRRLAADLGLANRARFLGMVDETPDVLSALDVIVHLPEQPESFGLAVVEGMAAGTPVVAADAWAIREIVQPGLTALLVTPEDSEALAAALLTLHDNPERREAIGAAGARAALEHFDARRMVRQVEAAYREVLAR